MTGIEQEIAKAAEEHANTFQQKHRNDIYDGFGIGAKWAMKKMGRTTEEQPQAVCQFGKTEYDSRIFDNLYRVWGDTENTTILSAYWEGELLSFKVKLNHHVVDYLIYNKGFGVLCGNYDWVRIYDPNFQKQHDKDKKEQELQGAILWNLNKSKAKEELFTLTKEELWYLADIAWYLKGFIAGQKEDDGNEFGQKHYDVVTKVINNCKQ